jgi:hypothetical protein
VFSLVSTCSITQSILKENKYFDSFSLSCIPYMLSTPCRIYYMYCQNYYPSNCLLVNNCKWLYVLEGSDDYELRKRTNGKPDNSSNDVVIENTVNLKKSVGLISGTSLIVGTVIGEFLLCRGRRGPALQLSLQTVSITNNFVSSNRTQTMQHYVIKDVSDSRQVGGFLRVFWFPPPIKLTATI